MGSSDEAARTVSGVTTYRLAVNDMKLTAKPALQATWAAVNRSFANRMMVMSTLAESIEEGRPFCCWLKGSGRKAEDFLLTQHIALDFDRGDRTSHPEYVAKLDIVACYGSIIYPTYSHTEDHPRCRVVFLLEEPIRVPELFTHATKELALCYNADSAATDPTRIFLGTSQTGLHILGRTMPSYAVNRLAASYTTRQGVHRTTPLNGDNPTLETIARVLNDIDPWYLSYGDWIQVLMALHKAYGEPALPLAVQWGDGAPREVEQKWQGFHDKPNGVGLGTIYHLAKRQLTGRTNASKVEG